jgi:rubrerythrin
MREKLIELAKDVLKYLPWGQIGDRTADDIADHFLANGVTVKSGAVWKPYSDYFTKRQVGWICSNCSVVIDDIANGDTPYCPYCGEPMETEDDE